MQKMTRNILFILFISLAISSCGGGGSSNNTTFEDQSSIDPVDPGPVDPGPVDPGPVDPGPVDPGPVDRPPESRILSITVSETEPTALIEVYTYSDGGIFEPLYTIQDNASLQYWNGTDFYDEETVLRYDTNSNLPEAYWEYQFRPGRAGEFTFRTFAYDLAGDYVPEANQTFTIVFISEEDPSLTFEDEQILIQTDRTITTNSSSSPHPITGDVFSVEEKLVANTITDLWRRNTTIKVGFDFGQNRNRFNRNDFFRNIAPLCQSPENAANPVSSRGGVPFEDNECFEEVARQVIFWANGWSFHGSMNFEKSNWQEADVRVTFNGNSAHSLRGRVDHEEQFGSNTATMNLGWLGQGVVLHEFGHVLGFAHEQSSPLANISWNLPFAREQYMEQNNWSAERATNQTISQINLTTDPYLETVGDYDPRSVMQYSIPMFAFRSSSPGVRMVQNWNEVCVSPDPNICIGNNQTLSDGDRRGMRVLYPTDDDLDTTVKSVEGAGWIEYSAALNREAHAVLYNIVPPEIQNDAYDNYQLYGKLSFSVSRELSADVTNRECEDLLELFCDTYVYREGYRADITYRGEIIGSRSFAIEGRRKFGGLQASSSAYLCSTVACLSEAVIR